MATEEPLQTNAADPKQVERSRDEEKLTRASEIADVRAVLGTLEGRRLLWRMLSACGVYQTPFDLSAERMAFKCGQQNIGHWLMAEIEQADDEALVRMGIEARQRLRMKNRERKAHNTTKEVEE